jgi:signal transduction histidine kinase
MSKLVWSRRHATPRALAVYLPGAVTLGADLWVPVDVDISAFYAIAIGLCGWLRSRHHLWIATPLFLVLIFVDLQFGAPPMHHDTPWWLFVVNRSLVSSALLMLAYVVHLWIGSATALEASRLVLERQNDQLRSSGAELERRVQERTQELIDSSRQRHEAEAALHQVQKMDAVGRLTGGLAHDFNNLLTVIAGNAELLRGMAATDRARDCVDAIVSAGASGQRLIRHLLTFARRQMLWPKVLALRERTRDIIDLIGRSLHQGIAIELAMAEDLWPVYVDPAELELALLNICINARDAMEKGGTLRIEAHNQVLRREDRKNGSAGDHVALVVSDTGAGIDPEILERVFEPFFTTKQAGAGTGLGLSQVYGFAKQSGGTVSIESAPGRGTLVTVYLPRSERPIEAAAGPPSAAPGGSAGRVLYVEDHPAVAAVTEEMIKELGYDVLWVDNAGAALELLDRGEKFDVVLSDIVMPGAMNGIELAREIQRRFPALPVLLTSAYAEAVSDAEREKLTILAKPYRTRSLGDALALCLASARRNVPKAPP